MAQALFSLRATSKEVHKFGGPVDLPSAAMMQLPAALRRGGLPGPALGGGANFDQLTAMEL